MAKLDDLDDRTHIQLLETACRELQFELKRIKDELQQLKESASLLITPGTFYKDQHKNIYFAVSVQEIWRVRVGDDESSYALPKYWREAGNMLTPVLSLGRPLTSRGKNR